MRISRIRIGVGMVGGGECFGVGRGHPIFTLTSRSRSPKRAPINVMIFSRDFNNLIPRM